jgi:hypothetical protein
MIPLNTPPGTEIVCIDDDINSHLVAGVNYRKEFCLSRGTVYTLKRWSCNELGNPTVHVHELPRRGITDPGYDARRFRLLEIPRCLTELLEREPEPVG